MAEIHGEEIVGPENDLIPVLPFVEICLALLRTLWIFKECGPTEPSFACLFGMAFAAVFFILDIGALLTPSDKDKDDELHDDELDEISGDEAPK